MKLSGYIGAIWGVSGVCLLLVFAVFRLSEIVVESLDWPLQWYHWLIFVANILFMAYSEGYKGFQLGFSPRVAARARHILHHPEPLRIILAPLFCMGYFHATRRRLISAYVLAIGIIFLIILFHQLSQPWRGLLDAGVVVGLSWGTFSLVWFAIKALGTEDFAFPAEVPEPNQ